VSVALEPTGAAPTDDNSVYSTPALHQDGSWAASLTLPATFPRGAYTLTATCNYSRSFTAFYPPVPVTVG